MRLFRRHPQDFTDEERSALVVACALASNAMQRRKVWKATRARQQMNRQKFESRL
jgi:hypothetical protein